MEWLSITIPILVVGILWIFYSKEITILEAILPPVAIFFVILLFNSISKENLTNCQEFWTGYITEARYYEDWNEYIHQTCTESYACGTDSKGNTQYCTRTYDCSYVRYHSKYWEMYDNNNITFTITKQKYESLIRKFKTEEIFVDMKRNYHTNDGDMYKIKFPGGDEKMEVVSSTHTYKNKVKVSNSVFKFRKISEEIKDRYKLYEYPKIENLKQRHILGIVDPISERKMELLNAKLGKKKQVKSFIFIYNSINKSTAEYQKDYLKGGNKNEFILCLGLDSLNNEISWVYPISWNTNKILEIKLRDHILENPDISIQEICDYLYLNIDNHFTRKEFKDFDYLEIELPLNYQITLWIITLIISISLGIFIIKNDIK